jgi:hypothetical protein
LFFANFGDSGNCGQTSSREDGHHFFLEKSLKKPASQPQQLNAEVLASRVILAVLTRLADPARQEDQ